MNHNCAYNANRVQDDGESVFFQSIKVNKQGESVIDWRVIIRERSRRILQWFSACISYLLRVCLNSSGDYWSLSPTSPIVSRLNTWSLLDLLFTAQWREKEWSRAHISLTRSCCYREVIRGIFHTGYWNRQPVHSDDIEVHVASMNWFTGLSACHTDVAFVYTLFIIRNYFFSFFRVGFSVCFTFVCITSLSEKK